MVMTRLLTADEVAERLGVTKDWVWAQARRGRIPHVQLGRYRRFREDTLEDWLQELEQRSITGRQREPRVDRRELLSARAAFVRALSMGLASGWRPPGGRRA